MIRAMRLLIFIFVMTAVVSGCAKAPQSASYIPPPQTQPPESTSPEVRSSGLVGQAVYEVHIKPYSSAYFHCATQKAKNLIFEPETPENIALAATITCTPEWLKLKSQLVLGLGEAKGGLAANTAEKLARETLVTMVVVGRAKIREHLGRKAEPPETKPKKRGEDI